MKVRAYIPWDSPSVPSEYVNRIIWFSAWMLVVPSLRAENWLHWRGPEQNGVSRDIGLVDNWSLEGINVLWESPIGGRATPIILNGRVFLNCPTSFDEDDPQAKIHAREQVVCWDLQTGKILWRDEFNVAQTDISAERVGWASMAGDAETGNVYMHSVSGRFRCYSSNGDILWEKWLGEEYGKISGFGGRTQTPIMDEDRVIVSFLAINWGATGRAPPKHFYYAFDKRTGDLLWVSAPGSKPHDTNQSVPIVKVIDGMRMLIGGNSDGGCYAMNARTGQSIWGFRMSKRGINASPVTAGRHVFISHGEDNIDNLKFGRVQSIDASGRGDITNTHSVWRVDGIKGGFPSLLVHDGLLYVVTDIGVLYAFDATTGQELWQHRLGSMGRGSPVWADGKLYVTEVHGNVYILRPSRTQCDILSHVRLVARKNDTYDGIFASPAIADGCVVIVSRDRTICLRRETGFEVSEDPVPTIEEKEPEQKIASIQLSPYETYLRPGDSIEFALRAYDRNGRRMATTKPSKLEFSDVLPWRSDHNRLTALASDRESAGIVFVNLAGHRATARLRVFPKLPWSWDFEGLLDEQIPPTWIRAIGKLRPVQVDGSTALLSRPGKGRPSNYIWLGTPEMSGYTIQADVMSREQKRRLSNVGITAQRYNLILKGNTGRLEVQSWAPQLRMAKEVSFRSDPDVWYRMKLAVETSETQALVKGKVWNRNDPEPDVWTIQAKDPHPNTKGSPGLYTYTLSDCYFDNVLVYRE